MNFTRYCVIGSGPLAAACYGACHDTKRTWLPMLDPEQPTLVVSARNSAIFPPAWVENPNWLIVNFHDSLLPRHRGRNAPSWAIYEQDKEVGITWHRVEEEIDRGHVLAQERVSLPQSKITALELTRWLIDMGRRSFFELLPRLLNDAPIPVCVASDVFETYHHRRQKPNDGMPDQNWDAEKLDAFNRAMDYGGLDPWK